MSATIAATTTGAPLATREIGTGLWLLVPRGDLDGGTVPALRSACVAALDRGGLDIVVDLRGVRTMCLDALDILALVSETLLARGGFLWLAYGGVGPSSDIAPIDERGLEAVEGVNQALDDALRADRIEAEVALGA
jgi:hypothetical protein